MTQPSLLPPSPPTARISVDDVVAVLERLRLSRVATEQQIHEAIAAVLHEAGQVALHEVTIAPRCRIDFVVDGRIGIEVKKGKPNGQAVRSQIERYCATGTLEAVILVVEQLAPNMPSAWRYTRDAWDHADGKVVEVRYLGLSKLWGIAL